MRTFGQLTASKKRTAKKVVQDSRNEQEATVKSANSSQSNPDVSVEKLREMAKSLGVEISLKRNWTKHTYTVTQENKILFDKYCSALDLKIQDAMEEAMSDWFKKHKKEYDEVKGK